MQFKIPQNVDIEDKIIAFITFRQLFIMIGGGAVAYAVFTISVDKMPVFAYAIPVVFILVLTLLIAFLKMDNMSFIKMILLMLERIINPSQRFWRHYADLPTAFDKLEMEMQLSPIASRGRTKGDHTGKTIKSLKSIADIVDSRGFVSGEAEEEENPQH